MATHTVGVTGVIEIPRFPAGRVVTFRTFAFIVTRWGVCAVAFHTICIYGVIYIDSSPVIRIVTAAAILTIVCRWCVL